MSELLSPPFIVQAELPAALRGQGYAAIDPTALAELTGAPLRDLQGLRASWGRLVTDAYLRDGGRYRRRRHSCYVLNAEVLEPCARRAHWQPLEYNALHGGLERWFEPVENEVANSRAWHQILLGLGRVASQLRGPQTWFVEAHQFRIDTLDGIGRPTPEGAHRDGVDLVAVLLVERHLVKGGETRVFDARGRTGQRFTMSQPWTTLLLDDARVIHESTPIQPLAPGGYRDTLVLTYRSKGFQGPPST